ncbi:MAG: hypothetical protein CME65_08140 [Halobacteriovoraceae bacterium]|nr:hypothetical protein [Halobacteriovoraceae bacterium]|tara:strand:- start:217 stop:681 length:465 start_codon:yes stop_codon:yes gene_type:complete
MQATNYKIIKNDIITIEFSAKLVGGKPVSQFKERGIVTFKVGDFPLVDGVNREVLDMVVGEIKSTMIFPCDAFGEVERNLINEISLHELPREAFVGQRMFDRKRKHFAYIASIDQDRQVALTDGNHLLAGEILCFLIKILDIKRPLNDKVTVEV